MFVVGPEDTAAIQAAFRAGGELAAVAELRRRFSIFVGRPDAHRVALAIVGWGDAVAGVQPAGGVPE